MNMHARESRFGVDIRSVTESGMPVQVFFEMDFYNLDRGPFNQAARLRHFYGVVGRLLVGRTWGTQSDLFAVPITIDFAAGDALTGTRRAQIRFEDRIGEKMSYAVAIEMLEFPGIDGPRLIRTYPAKIYRFSPVDSPEKRNPVEGSCSVLRFFNCAGMG
jgi:hypothetical protein